MPQLTTEMAVEAFQKTVHAEDSLSAVSPYVLKISFPASKGDAATICMTSTNQSNLLSQDPCINAILLQADAIVTQADAIGLHGLNGRCHCSGAYVHILSLQTVAKPGYAQILCQESLAVCPGLCLYSE